MTRRDFLLGTTLLPVLFKFTGRQTSEQSSIKFSSETKLESLDLSRLLASIALVETGGDDTKIGKSGERSKYQIGEKVWYQWVSYPHVMCAGMHAKSVAAQHISWLHAHIGDSIFALALGWHVGLENWRAARFQLPQRYYGERVRNLYNSSLTLT